MKDCHVASLRAMISGAAIQTVPLLLKGAYMKDLFDLKSYFYPSMFPFSDKLLEISMKMFEATGNLIKAE
ncbi:MAG: hypothetical protein JRD69_05950 [Deltaproteobacteria bacterium]|nr:hypothetical protein [Deltaproteobacteria bacterium]